MVWLYNNTERSLFAVITFHAMIDVSVFSFPNYGSYYDPGIAFIFIAIASIAVAAMWEPTTLARYRAVSQT